MTGISKESKEKIFNEFIQSEDKTIKKFENIENRMNFLNIPNEKEILEKYKDVLICDHNLEKHMNVIRILKSDDYIKNKLNKIDGETFKVKTVQTVYNKIHILRNFEKTFNLKPLQIDFEASETLINIKDELCSLVKKLFRNKQDKPTNMKEFKPIYITMIKNICGSDIIESKRVRDGKNRYQMYNLNTDYIIEHL
jgi:hypothetical protein